MSECHRGCALKSEKRAKSLRAKSLRAKSLRAKSLRAKSLRAKRFVYQVSRSDPFGLMLMTQHLDPVPLQSCTEEPEIPQSPP